MRISPPSVAGRLPMLVVVSSLPPVVQSYVVGGGGSVPSRLAEVRCELQMTVGRTPDTKMPPEWASSGDTLVMPLTLQFSVDEEYFRDGERVATAGDEALSRDEDFWREERTGALPGEAPFLVQPLNEPSFASVEGQEKVEVRAGQCLCASTPGSEQHSLRFSLDFPDGAVKNDVTLPAEKIYFMATCWDNGDKVLARARRSKEDAVRSFQRVKAELEEMDRQRTNPFGGSFFRQFPRYASLTKRRRKLAKEINKLDFAFPPENRLVAGPNDVVFLKEGVIAVRRVRKGREKFQSVGTFRFKKFSATP